MADDAAELNNHPLRLKPLRLRRVCDPKTLTFKTTAELEPFDGLIGQSRALEALDMGARIDKPGFNVFVLGERGTARRLGLCRKLRPTRPPERDRPAARPRGEIQGGDGPRNR